jgi:hypothetical protein
MRMSSNSLHHTTFSTVAQAEMQETGAMRWSCWYVKQLKRRESEDSQREREREHGICLPLYIMYCLQSIQNCSCIPHPNLESSYSTQWSW